LLVVVAVKIFATGTTIGSGGSGGIFAPSLFMGASVGGAFGTLVGRLMPSGTVARPPAYATVAMGAVVSAATHAPLQAILIVFELTDRHTIILPLMLSCILSAVMAMRLSRESIYTLKLIRRGSRVGAGRESEIMSETQVRDLARPVEETLHPDTRLDEVVDRVVEHRHPEIYVIDDTGQLHGLVDIEDVATILRDAEDLQAVLVAADVMRPCIGSVHPEDTLDRCLILFSQRQVKRLPVVNDQGLLIGRISRADVIGHYNREILRRDAVLRFDDTVEEPAKSGERVHLAHGDIKAEIPVAGSLVGRTLRDLDLRARFEVSVYAVRDQEGESRFPDPGRPLLHGETLEVHGPAGGINQVRRLASE
jgi:CIC family chloride channel protein